MGLKNLFLPRGRKRKKTDNAFGTSTGNALDNYVRSAPSVQNALDLFRGEWATRIPSPPGTVWETGVTPAFEDPRFNWFLKEINGIEGMSVLELGPMEAEHAYMLEKAGASRILSIEANQRAYLKCLIVKEVLKLNRVTFMCGDFVEYLRNTGETFDLCLASGVLYHMRNPVELIERAAAVADRLYLWTHYYDEELIHKKSYLKPKFPSHKPAEHKGLSHTLYRFEYRASLDYDGFCGGSSDHSNWLTRGDILRSLEHFGFDQVRTGWEQPEHENGPAFAVLAVRSESQKRRVKGDS